MRLLSSGFDVLTEVTLMLNECFNVSNSMWRLPYVHLKDTSFDFLVEFYRFRWCIKNSALGIASTGIAQIMF